MPDGVRSCDNDLGLVTQPVMKSGDVLFFMDGAQTHGTHPWRSQNLRKSVLIKYTSENSVRAVPSRNLYKPEIWWGKEIVADMTEEQRAVMCGPGVHHGGLVKPLTVEEDGTVCIDPCE